MNHKNGVFPFDALRPLIETRVPAAVTSGGVLIRPGSASRVADVIGVSMRTVQRWQSGQHLTIWSADLAATRLGTHPSLVWPDWSLDLEEVS